MFVFIFCRTLLSNFYSLKLNAPVKVKSPSPTGKTGRWVEPHEWSTWVVQYPGSWTRIASLVSELGNFSACSCVAKRLVPVQNATKMVERNKNKLYPIVLPCHPSPNFYPKIVLAKVKYIYIAFGYIFLFWLHTNVPSFPSLGWLRIHTKLIIQNISFSYFI